MLEQALHYLKTYKWSIIPIQKGSKKPAIQSWTKYQTQLPSEDEVRAWWGMWKDANIAVVCGQVSGIIIVDIDSGHGEVDTKGLQLPPTLAQTTGSGGSHLVYKWRKGLAHMQAGIRKGVDIRSDNSYAVIPPSIHPNGKAYEWVDEDMEIEDAPSWLEVTEDSPTDWNKFFTDKNDQGIRNMSATQLAGKIMYEMSYALWEPLGYPTFQEWNKNYNKPLLEPEELRNVWESIKRTHLKNNGIPQSEGTESKDDGIQAIIELFKKNKTEATFLLAKYIVTKYTIITIGEREREMFIYQDGMYRPGADNLVIYPEIQTILSSSVTKSAKSETYHKICDATAHPRSIFQDTPARFIPLKNGVYDFETKELLPHSPEYHFTYQFPVIYSPEATCPKTEAFLDQVLTPKQRLIMEEWMGFYFWRNYMFKKAIIFVGAGDTGKTTLLEVVTHLLGRPNISSISLQKMTGDKFSAAHLYEKHGNLVDELSARDVTDTGAFKMATGGGSVTGEYKFGNQFSFHNFSKFTFACNRIPDVQEMNDEAYFNRWMVIRFENRIETVIPNFIATLTTEEERSGLFNLAMRGLARLLGQSKFSYTNTAEQTKVEMMRSGSSIAMFVGSALEKEYGAEMDKEEMYQQYILYCEANNLSAQTKEMLGKRMQDYCSFIADGQSTDFTGKKKVRVWRNAIIKGSKEIKKAEDIKAEEAFTNF